MRRGRFIAACLLFARSAAGAVCPAGSGSSLAAAAILPTGDAPRAVAAGDFNGDGKADLAVANLGVTAGSSFVSIYLGAGDGSFGAPTPYGVGLGALGLAALDVDSDGKLDLATANSGAGSVSVLLGLGDGSFAPAIDLAVGLDPRAIASADFDGDGTLDLAVANAGSDDVSVMLGTGAGGFAAAASFAAGSAPAGVVVGDWNGDSKVDLAAAGSFGVWVLLGDGAGSFGPATQAPAGFNLTAIASGDWNGDAKADLAVLSTEGLRLLLGDGVGGFVIGGVVSGPAGPKSLAIGDLNGDGEADFAVVGDGPQLFVFSADGSGSIAGLSGSTFALPGGSRSVVAADANGDGRADLAVTSYLEPPGVASSAAQPGDVRVFLANCANVAATVVDGFASEGGSVLFTLNLSVASEHVVTVDYATSGGTAAAGSDYQPASGTLTFAPGARWATLPVATIDDSSKEDTETFLLALGNAVNASIAIGQATGSITDDEALPQLSIADASVIEGNAGTTSAYFTVTLSGASQAPVTVSWATGSNPLMTATPDADYLDSAGTLVFPSGETHKTIQVPVVGDTSAEPAETFLVSLAGVSNALLLDGTAVGTILDDDCVTLSPGIADGGFEAGYPWPDWTTQTSSNFATPLCDGSFCFSGTSQPYQGGNWAWFGGTSAPEIASLGQSLVLPADPRLVLRFRLWIGYVSAPFTDSLVLQVDGNPVATFVEPATPEFGYSVREVSLAGFADGGSHSLLWSYSSAGGPEPDWGSDFSLDEIELCTLPVVPMLAISDASVTEGNAGGVAARFLVSLSPPASAPTSVDWATAPNTASSPADFASGSGTLLFGIGESAQWIDVTVAGDSSVEPNETFFVELSAPSGAQISRAQAIGSIVNDDYPPAPRAYVSVDGSDSNPCTTPASPCRTFVGAIVRVLPGGEVVAITSGTFGGGTIAKSVTINAPVGVAALVATPLVIEAGVADIVSLRGLTFVSPTPGSGTALTFSGGAGLNLERTVIHGWSTGLSFAVAGKLNVVDSVIRDNAVDGISLSADSGAIEASLERTRFLGNGTGLRAGSGSRATVRDCVAAGNAVGLQASSLDVAPAELTVADCMLAHNAGAGLAAGALGTARISGSTVAYNTIGLQQSGDGVLLSSGDNTVEANATDTAGTIGVVAAKAPIQPIPGGRDPR